MDFSGRRALVTGAASGIGRETARRLAAAGATVFALGRRADSLDTLRQEIGCEIVAVDLRDTQAIAAAVRPVLPVDLLVNCAGIVLVEDVLDTPVDSFVETMAVNALAPLRLVQIVAAELIRQGRPGVVVNVSSLAAQVGTPGHVAYCASKAALDAMTRVMAVELGPHLIRVNSVNPVVTLTPMAALAWSDPDKAARMRARIPLGRFAEPGDVADAICFLLSDAAAMVNGVCLNVDGGFRAA